MQEEIKLERASRREMREKALQVSILYGGFRLVSQRQLLQMQTEFSLNISRETQVARVRREEGLLETSSSWIRVEELDERIRECLDKPHSFS